MAVQITDWLYAKLDILVKVVTFLGKETGATDMSVDQLEQSRWSVGMYRRSLE